VTSWVDADAILTAVGFADPTAASPADSAWAGLVADAVNAGIDHRLDGAVIAVPLADLLTAPPVLPAELVLAARYAGAEAYKRREATFGLTGFVDLQGAAIRIARDYLEAVAPIIARYATVGIS
jgi:mannose/fructose/N-acetylgalactosamine-specific phosphotransferase system component IIC